MRFLHGTATYVSVSTTVQLHVVSKTYRVGPRPQVIDVPDVSSVVSGVGAAAVDHHRE